MKIKLIIMELKKNPQLDVGRNSSLFFAVGLNVMLLLTWQAIEFKTYEKSNITADVLQISDDIEEEIPIVDINLPPPPPPPKVVTESIIIAEDIDEIEETIIESTEANQDDIIEEPTVAISDVVVDEVEEDIIVPFAVIEKIPIFPGCKGSNEELKACFQKKMKAHLQKHFKYPDEALNLGIYGKVFVYFIIDKNGNVSKIKSRGPDKVLETEAERIIGLLPKMIPGKQRNRAVSVPYSLPINFVLAD
jgi:protein TonB